MDRAADVLFDGEGVHLCGHRGHSMGGTENSKTSFRDARGRGATMCEIDVRLTADDEYVVYHDPILDTTSTGRGPVRNRSLKDLRALTHKPRFGSNEPERLGDPLTSLEETLEFAGELQLGLIIEVKDRLTDAAHIRKLVEIVDSSSLRDRVLLSSFDHRFLKELKDAHPQVSTFGIMHSRHVSAVRLAQEAELDVYSVDYPRFHECDAQELTEAGINVATFFPRTVVVENEWDSDFDGLSQAARSARAGHVKILGMDDVSWGKSYFAKNQIRQLDFAQADVMA